MSTAPQATVIFPPHSFIDPINTKDSINVTYKSSWQYLNLTILCIGSPNSNNLLYHNIDNNPIQGTGSYITPSIESMEFSIEQYPTQCKIRLTQYGDNNINADGGDFILTSIQNQAAATYEKTTTIFPTQTSISNRTLIVTDTNTPPTPPQKTTFSSTTSAFPSPTSASTLTSSSSSSSTMSHSSPSSTSRSPSLYPGVLSKEASAAIGIGVALAVVVTMFVSFWIFLAARRRKRIATMTRSAVTTPDSPMHAKAELYGNATHVSPRQNLIRYEASSKYGEEIDARYLSPTIVSPISRRADRYSRYSPGMDELACSRHELECRARDNCPRHELEAPKANFSRPRHELA